MKLKFEKEAEGENTHDILLIASTLINYFDTEEIRELGSYLTTYGLYRQREEYDLNVGQYMTGEEGNA